MQKHNFVCRVQLDRGDEYWKCQSPRASSAKIPDATQSSVTGLQWFKIYEDGLTPSTQAWAVDRLIQNKGKVSFTIPPCIVSGQYLLRHEIIGASPSACPALRLPRGRARPHSRPHIVLAWRGVAWEIPEYM